MTMGHRVQRTRGRWWGDLENKLCHCSASLEEDRPPHGMDDSQLKIAWLFPPSGVKLKHIQWKWCFRLWVSQIWFCPQASAMQNETNNWGQQDALPVPDTTALTLLCLVDGVALMQFYLMIFLLTIGWLRHFPSSNRGESVNLFYGWK